MQRRISMIFCTGCVSSKVRCSIKRALIIPVCAHLTSNEADSQAMLVIFVIFGEREDFESLCRIQQENV